MTPLYYLGRYVERTKLFFQGKSRKPFVYFRKLKLKILTLHT